MYKDVLRSIEGVDIFPVIGFIIFFTFFLTWSLYAFKMKKETVTEISSLPLDLEEETENNSTNEFK
ncbi:cbb3-type cytochrome c oxidase subunit 3 [Flammeovirga pectinis]|uniref:Cbb3-type cytochrome c oxidase subunit 3 n=1 Tax=Flammeovirga pectinis TaxID=2494373 RepID=A0A3Q9FLB6_9BACT|nr:cbb3-type cytochrome c oxidase subunit 3 [Flammeovirga pectinis]AZQ60841.1 cbb3-type cytochrome c oxidase subunit 3 [Flammeovirga pectinis]